MIIIMMYCDELDYNDIRLQNIILENTQSRKMETEGCYFTNYNSVSKPLLSVNIDSLQKISYQSTIN